MHEWVLLASQPMRSCRPSQPGTQVVEASSKNIEVAVVEKDRGLRFLADAEVGFTGCEERWVAGFVALR